MRSTALAWLCLLVIGCRGGSGIDADQARAELESYCEAEYQLAVMSVFEVPNAPWPDAKPTPQHYGHVVDVSISPEGVAVDGVPTTSLERALADARSTRGKPEGDLDWTLLPSKGATLSEVDSTLDTLRESLGPAGTLQFGLEGVKRPMPPDPARHEQLFADLMAAGLDGRSTFIVTSLQAQADACRGLERALDEAGEAPPRDRCTSSAELLPKALSRCSADVGREVMSIMYLLFVGSPVTRTDVVIQVAAQDDPDAIVLEYSGGVWGDVVAEWLATKPTRPIRLQPSP